MMWPFDRKVLIATAVQAITWVDVVGRPEEKITILFFEGARRRRRSFRVVRHGLGETYCSVPSWIGEVEIWAAGGPLPSRARLVRHEGKPALRVVGE